MREILTGEHANRILVVDDTTANLQLLTNLLTEHGYTVHPASDGELALEFVRTTVPDLILLDIRMPGVDGYEVCRRLKAEEMTRNVPVIFISILEDERDKVKGFRHGAVDYITKPFQREEVLARVTTHLRIRELTRELEQAKMCLEKRVDERTAELSRANRKLQSEITERKRSEEALRLSEARYRSLFEESIDGVFISSAEGKIIDINMTGVRIFGYESKEEMTRLDLVRDVYANTEDRNRFLSVIDRKGSGEYEVVLRKKDGKTMLARVSMAVVRDYDGNVVGYQGVVRDITEKRRLEQELFKAKKMEIIGQLAGGVAHEVRNPLNVILSISEAFFREKEIANNPEYLPYIQHMRTHVGRLSKLMSDLLDLGKPIKSASIHPVVLPKVCTTAIELWKMTEAAEAHSVSFDSEGVQLDLPVYADSGRLQQVLLNLMDNAAQHSPKGAGIVLSIEKTGDRKVAVRVRDTGKGIASEKLERVFDPFFTTRIRGTGLGLALVKHFVESMGGSVKIMNNEPPPGCSAEVILSMEATR